MSSRRMMLTIAAVAMLSFIASFFGSLAMADEATPVVIKITAQKFKYTPDVINVKKGVPVVLEFTSLDRLHGFNCPDLKIRTDIEPGKVNRLEFTPQKAGTFPFHCDNFCGTGHDGMKGTIVVTE